MGVLGWIGLGAAALVVAGALAVRIVPMDPAEWHADPSSGPRSGQPNDFLVGPGGDLPVQILDAPVAAVMEAVDAVAAEQPRTFRLAGDPSDGHVTYVQRSRVMGFPDAVSVKADATDGGTALTIWSRSRYGRSDLGMNAARVSDWLGRIRAALDG
ncbi:DUF1499 domain-containing protein [Jannaschia sp. LMIT008]|uniref:DUF1499 domain-containing protein n=1 Tax=Jannaschia maritima TaxID=3032585 RepID=UPI0028122D23|nr:DUF1499 domain-containing protein [Jannaschia sp. LMIT008]